MPQDQGALTLQYPSPMSRVDSKWMIGLLETKQSFAPNRDLWNNEVYDLLDRLIEWISNISQRRHNPPSKFEYELMADKIMQLFEEIDVEMEIVSLEVEKRK
ncbi:hypothetical protein Tco_0975188 [Tanacetum coccineum]|uniref:Uncharacterized protein n=1 Tax=Tanacetum coccineum TaxID=301880 RepID=A0ABQ5EDX9_9ASTR